MIYLKQTFKRKFNVHFSNQGSVLNNNSILPDFSYLTEERLNNISFDGDKISKIINDLNPSKAHGFDGISIRMLKMCNESITTSLSLFSNAAVIGITESKLDDSIPNSEIDIDNYNLIRCDRNRQGGGVACYIRNDLNFNKKTLFTNEIENIFVDILLPKTKPFTVGIFYRPPNKYKFLENITEDFSKLNTENNDLFILGDMNINLSENGKYIFDKNNTDNTACSLVKGYKEFISTFGLKQLIRHPTRVTCNTSSLIDHILTNSEDKISQSGIIDVGLSDHQLIFCTRKLTKKKTGITKYINSRSMKNYTKEILKEKLQSINFPNYTNFQNTNSAYSDFINKITVIINSIAPMKHSKVKNNSQEWFDGEVAVKIAIRDKTTC